jgi:Surp module
LIENGNGNGRWEGGENRAFGSHHPSSRDQRYVRAPSENVDIAEIIEKTASYVSRNSKDFEERIRKKERANPKFAFLNPVDPYFKYYEWRLTELQTGGTKSSTPFPTRTLTPQIKKPTGQPRPPPYYFSGKLPPMSAQHLDILRLTALFVARHGNPFQQTVSGARIEKLSIRFPEFPNRLSLRVPWKSLHHKK